MAEDFDSTQVTCKIELTKDFTMSKTPTVTGAGNLYGQRRKRIDR